MYGKSLWMILYRLTGRISVHAYRNYNSNSNLLSNFIRKQQLATNTSMGDSRVMLILAEGAEEMEAVITADVLRRGGVDVTIAGVYTLPSG